MAKLIYATNVSLDGYIEDERGGIDMGPLDDDLFTCYSDLLRSVGALAAQSDLMADFAAAWQAANKVVYSTSLAAVPTARTRLEHRFDPASVRDIKASATRDLTVGGAHLAAQAFKAGLVDECRLWVWPVIIGGGKPALPSGDRADLELLDERRFGNGVVQLRYRIPS
jgi:dihydrofolate reductase